MPFSEKWMGMEIMMLRKISQPTNITHFLSDVESIYKREKNIKVGSGYLGRRETLQWERKSKKK